MTSTIITDYIGRGLHADRPVSPPVSSGATAIYFETDTNKTFVWSGSIWVEAFSGSTVGTVTSVALTVPGELNLSGSPVTSSGTLALSWANQAGNVVLASPSGGGSGTPGFRNLVPKDIPGTAILYGPYVVDYTDIPHNNDVMTLWVPQVGDVLLRLFPDVGSSLVQWDYGTLSIGQNVDPGTGYNTIALADAGNIGGPIRVPNSLDSVVDANAGSATDAVGNEVTATARVFSTTDPVQIALGVVGTEPSQGHVELYALVARAIAP